MSRPYLFDEFFSSGLEESVSPFLTPETKKFSYNLPLKSALLSAFFLSLSFGFSFTHKPLSNFFLTFVFFFAGAPSLIGALKDLKNLEVNIDVLMTLAAFLAISIGSGIEGGLLLVLFELSHGMEEMVSHKAKSAIHNLNEISPKFAVVLAQDGTLFEKAVREIEVGAHLFVKQGEIVPLDGTVLNGSSSLNLVHLTGESIPVPVSAGKTVPAGARNLDSALVLEVTRISSDSTLSKIIQLIVQAQEAKPKVERWLDRFGKQYASSIITLTFLFALSLPYLFALPFFGNEGSIYRSLAFLIAASPCALIIATPTAYLSAISACAKNGILLKGGIVLDALASCKRIAFDKTGTLTTGNLQCFSVEPLGSTEKNDAIAIAAALEQHVTHPMSLAICDLAKHLKLPSVQDIEVIAGFGIRGKLIDKTKVAIGLPSQIAPKLSPMQKGGEGLALLDVGGSFTLFRFSDEIRDNAKQAIHDLKFKCNLLPLMLTGDHEQSAKKVATELNFPAFFADLRPEEKLKKVAEIAEMEGLAMVGDGINDAPALTRATVGISMGKVGSASAIDASDVVLLNDDLSLLSYLFSHAKKTQKIVRQNLSLALSVICFATIPSLLGFIPLWMAVILHEGGTVLVGLNSLRLLSRKK